MLGLSSATVLVIAPHPDDEAFGCGGLIYRLKASGNQVYVLYMTVGNTADFSARGVSRAEERLDEVEAVARHFDLDGYAVAFPGDAYHLRLDAMPQTDLVHAIERGSDLSLQALCPEVVLTTSASDYNQDHRAVATATLTAARPGPREHKTFAPLVLTYELPYQQWCVADAPAAPSLFVTLDGPALAAKRRSLDLYASQLKSPDCPLSQRGVDALASFRGLQCGAPAAEAFCIKRLVV